MVIAAGVQDLETKARSFRWLVASCGIVLLTLISVALYVVRQLQSRVQPSADYDNVGPLRLVPVVLVFWGITAIVMGLRRRIRTSLIASLLAILMTVLLLLHPGQVYPGCVLDGFSVRLAFTLFSSVNRNVSEKHLYSYKLNRSYEYPLDFYLRRELVPWPGTREPRAVVFTEPKYRSELRRLGLNCPDPFMEELIVLVCSD
jgi:hypothetical protein